MGVAFKYKKQENRYQSRLKMQSDKNAYSAEPWFEEFLKLWDKDTLQRESSIKILFLDSNSKKLDSFNINRLEMQEIKKAFQFAQNNVVGTDSIVIGKNDPEDDMIIDESIEKIVELFVEQSKLFSLPIKDFIIFSSWGYTSFRENKYI